MGDGKETEEADGGDAVRTDDEGPAGLVLVGVEGNERGPNHTKCEDGNGKKLGVGGRVSEAKDDTRSSVGEAVDGDGVTLSNASS